ncbi:MAG TPA: hypothetical protein VMS74_00105 [Acidimicrobiia bacterium]|nr:hypothetical protein [Acidimicrobiia bacterium]
MEGDPAIRWQVMRDLTDEPPQRVAAERALVATTGWGARLLGLQTDDGLWGGGDYSPKWTSTTYTLLLLRHLGIDPANADMRRAAGLVNANVFSGRANQPFFSYRGETCISGMTLALGSYFLVAPDKSAQVAEWILGEQLEDGGWNCQTVNGSRVASFHTTISALEGLAEYRAGAGGDAAISAAIGRGQEYLLERRLFRRRSTGEVVNPRWMLFSFPPRWHYDVLRGLDHLRQAQAAADSRCDEALAVVEGKRGKDGRWPLQNPHRGLEHFGLEEGAGRPSRWNTLRAMRVLR